MNLKDDMILMLDYYDKEIVRLICNKYGYPHTCPNNFQNGVIF